MATVPVFLSKWNSGNNPAGITIDSNGDVYVIDGTLNVVNKYDSLGVFILSFGSGTLSNSRAITHDGSDNIYVTSRIATGLVFKFDSVGNLLTSWVVPDFATPNGITWSPFNNFIYVIRTNNGFGRIFVYDLIGNPQFDWGDNGTNIFTGSTFDVLADSQGFIFATEAGENIHKFNPVGGLPIATINIGGNARGLALGQNDDIYVCQSSDDKVIQYDNDLNFILEWGSLGTSDGEFDATNYIDRNLITGDIYVDDVFTTRVQRFGQPITPIGPTDPPIPDGFIETITTSGQTDGEILL